MDRKESIFFIVTTHPTYEPIQAYFSQDKEHDTSFEYAGSLNKILVKWLDCVDIC